LDIDLGKEADATSIAEEILRISDVPIAFILFKYGAGDCREDGKSNLVRLCHQDLRKGRIAHVDRNGLQIPLSSIRPWFCGKKTVVRGRFDELSVSGVSDVSTRILEDEGRRGSTRFLERVVHINQT
jgi:hypothetical protein